MTSENEDEGFTDGRGDSDPPTPPHEDSPTFPGKQQSLDIPW